MTTMTIFNPNFALAHINCVHIYLWKLFELFALPDLLKFTVFILVGVVGLVCWRGVTMQNVN